MRAGSAGVHLCRLRRPSGSAAGIRLLALFLVLQEGIAPDETVEIRLTLDREGDYREARYRIGYIQLEGDGEVFAADGTRLVNRELTELSGIAGLDTTDIRRQVFTLFYRNTGEDNPGIRFVAVDNFRVERTLDIPFSIEDKANMDTIK